MANTYDEVAVQQILARARARQGQNDPLERSQLIDISRELNISPANFLAAEEEWLVWKEEQDARAAFDHYRHQQWIKGLRRFAIASSLLMMSNLLATRQLSWALYIALGWAIVLSIQAWQTYRSSEESYNRAFRRWWLRQQIGESFKAISERLRSASPGETARNSLRSAEAESDTAINIASDSPDSAHSLSGHKP
ncbi:MAG: 2TM domain-containing protein [Elainellaceae cyanobacterium]